MPVALCRRTSVSPQGDDQITSFTRIYVGHVGVKKQIKSNVASAVWTLKKGRYISSDPQLVAPRKVSISQAYGKEMETLTCDVGNLTPVPKVVFAL